MSAALNDPRAGWTSASNAEADALCPARHLAQKGKPESVSEFAESGRKIHAALAMTQTNDTIAVSDIVEKFTPEERQTYTDCLAIQRKLTIEMFRQGHQNFREFKEQRYWAKFKANGKEYSHSGQADYVARAGTHALILDYKTMPGDVPHSSSNLQLRDLACLVRGTLVPTDEIAVAIVQPWVTKTPTLCVYTKDDLDRATKEMFRRVLASNNPESKPVAGEVQCKYCRAHSSCVAYQQWAGKMTPPSLQSILALPLDRWTPEQRAMAADALAPAEKFLDELKANLKALLTKDPNAVPGWELKPGVLREHINNPQAVFERFAALGGKVEQFMPTVSVTKSKLKAVLSDLTGAKGKALESAMGTLVDGLTASEQTAPSLKRKDS